MSNFKTCIESRHLRASENEIFTKIYIYNRKLYALQGREQGRELKKKQICPQEWTNIWRENSILYFFLFQGLPVHLCSLHLLSYHNTQDTQQHTTTHKTHKTYTQDTHKTYTQDTHKTYTHKTRTRHTHKTYKTHTHNTHNTHTYKPTYTSHKIKRYANVLGSILK